MICANKPTYDSMIPPKPRVALPLVGLTTLSLLTLLHAAEIVGHRGASHDAPENTLTAMNLAWRQKADGIETDIHLSKDGHIVVLHDPDTKRVAGVELRADSSNWELLRTLDVGRWKGVEWAGEKIPTLDSIIATIPEEKFILIEMKSGPEVLPALEKVINASGGKADRIRLISFDFRTCGEAKIRFPDHEIYWLSHYERSKFTGQYPDVNSLIDKAKAAKLDGLSLNQGFPINADFLRKIHQAGLRCHVWTVDDPQTARKLVQAGVDGIITNRPEYLRTELER